MPTARRFSFLSLLLFGLVAWTIASPAWLTRIQTAPNRDALVAALQGIPPEIRKDPGVKRLIADAETLAAQEDWRVGRQRLVAGLEARGALAAQPTAGRVADPKAAAARILANPLYRDTSRENEQNWLAAAIQRVGDWLDRLLSGLRGPEATMPDIGAPPISLGVLQPLVWALLAIGLGVLVYFAARHFRLGPRRRKVGGLLEEDEPERTADEWLLRAAELEAAGRFREAVRCLYLACLMRMDDAGVARFVRSETNWEHHARIMTSPKRPPTLDFTPTTQSFDRVWYGHILEGAPDVARFREFYTSVVRELAARSAA